MLTQHSLDHSKVAKVWRERGYSCGMWIDHAGREWKNEPQETDELFMVLSGEIELELGEQRLSPCPGEEILIPAGRSHRIRNIGGKTARWLYGQPLAIRSSAFIKHREDTLAHTLG